MAGNRGRLWALLLAAGLGLFFGSSRAFLLTSSARLHTVRRAIDPAYE